LAPALFASIAPSFPSGIKKKTKSPVIMEAAVFEMKIMGTGDILTISGLNLITRKDDKRPIPTEINTDMISPMRNSFFFITPVPLSFVPHS
jgi:hypothetical protein